MRFGTALVHSAQCDARCRQHDGSLHLGPLNKWAGSFVCVHRGARRLPLSRGHLLCDRTSCKRQLPGRVFGGVRVSCGVDNWHRGGVPWRNVWCEWAQSMPSALHGRQVRTLLWLGVVGASVWVQTSVETSYKLMIIAVLVVA
jgi:hypothetical protein